MVLLEAPSPPPLAVTLERSNGPTSVLRLHGERMGLLPRDGRRSLSEARRLMPVTAQLRTMQDLRHELGDRPWGDVHLALCAELQPHFVPAGQLILSGMQALRRPMIILDGYATLLSHPAPTASSSSSSSSSSSQPLRSRDDDDDDDQPDEATELLPGDCLSAAITNWLHPRAIAAIARTDVQLLVLPGPVFTERCQLQLLRRLQRRERTLASLPLLRRRPASGLRALAHAAAEASYAAGQPICREGSVCDGLQVLLSGSAKVCVKLAAPGIRRPKPTPAAAAALAQSRQARGMTATPTAATAAESHSSTAPPQQQPPPPPPPPPPFDPGARWPR